MKSTKIGKEGIDVSTSSYKERKQKYKVESENDDNSQEDKPLEQEGWIDL